jgi:type III restriction enzyme
VTINGIRDKGLLDYRLLGQGSVEVHHDHEIPNVAAELAERTHLTRRTIRRIISGAGNLDQVFHNPADYLQQVGDAINATKRRFLVDGVQYLEIAGDERAGVEPAGALWEMSLFDDVEAYEDSLVPIEKSVYEAAIVDSQVERDFALALEQLDEVKLFVKLPGWFTVETPIGGYNPDWAILMVTQDQFGEEKERLYLVRETKGSGDPEARRGTENMKITCAEAHFAELGVDYRDVMDAGSLRDTLVS